jgi:hypothetical protein
LKKKKVFLFEFGFWAESLARPSWPPYATQLASATTQQFAGVHLRSEAESDQLSESDPITPDLT